MEKCRSVKHNVLMKMMPPWQDNSPTGVGSRIGTIGVLCPFCLLCNDLQ